MQASLRPVFILICIAPIFAKRQNVSLYTADDFKIDKIDAFALAGGGFNAFIEEWTVLYMLAKHNDADAANLLKNKSVGSTGSGSLFMNALLYDKDVLESFSKDKGDFHTAITTEMQGVAENLKQKVKSQSSSIFLDIVSSLFCGESAPLNTSELSTATNVICDKSAQDIFSKLTALNNLGEKNNAWKELIQAVNSEFADEPNFDVDWSTLAAVTTELQYDYKSDKYFRSKFFDDVSEEKHEKYLDYAGFPTFISYKGNTSEVSVPRLENDFGEKDVQLWKMVNHYSWWGFGSDEEKVTPWKASVSEIKSKIKSSVDDCGPKCYSGPSTAILGNLGNWHILDSLLPHLTNNAIGVDDVSNAPLKKLENELYGFVWKTKDLEDGAPVGLVGGALFDNSGIVAAVKNLQQKYPEHEAKTIVAISSTKMNAVKEEAEFLGQKMSLTVDNFEFQFLFEDSNVGLNFSQASDDDSWTDELVGTIASTVSGISTESLVGLDYDIQGFVGPEATIFKGAYEHPSQISHFGNLQIAAFDDLETVQNTDYGIKAGYKYNVILILPNCALTNDSLFPQANNKKGMKHFANCSRQIIKDMDKFLQSLEAKKKPVPENKTEDSERKRITKV